MRIPDESLDDFTVKADLQKTAEPPAPVSLRFTGEVEVLKPLARWEVPVKPDPAAVDTHLRPAPHRLSWFHRSLALGGGLAMIALILASAIIIGISDPPADAGEYVADSGDQSDLAIDGLPDGRLLPAEESLSSDIFSVTSSPFTFEGRRAVRSTARPRRTRPRVQFAAYRPRRNPRRVQIVVSQFVPTTLVISLENGEIKTHIEPQLTAGYTKQLTLPN